LSFPFLLDIRKRHKSPSIKQILDLDNLLYQPITSESRPVVLLLGLQSPQSPAHSTSEVAMAPKNKPRNNKLKKSQDPRPPITTPCPRCNEAIIVPKTCKHGKKLINCQGTGCGTAHIEEHKAKCSAATATTTTTTPSAQPLEGIDFSKVHIHEHDGAFHIHENCDCGAPAPGLASASAAAPGPTTTAHPGPKYLAMHLLTLQVNALVALRGGKAPKYIGGKSWSEWFAGLEMGDIEAIEAWTEELRGVVDGRKTAEEVGYDDEESGESGGAPTPEQDEDEE